MPTKPTPAELNRLLAERLGMDLGARTDGKNDYHIAGRWMRDHGDPGIIRPVYRTYNDNPDNPFYDIIDFQWNCREGQPWQESIEAFHAAWRREPPDWAGDLMTAFEMLPLMEERKLGDEYSRELRWRCQNNKRYPFANGIYAAVAHASARQRSEAALLALGGSLDE